MTTKGNDIIHEHPGVGQLIADNLVGWLRGVAQGHPLMISRNPQIRAVETLLFTQSSTPGIAIGEVRATYEQLIQALGAIMSERARWQVVSRGTEGPLGLPNPMPFDQILARVVAEIQSDCPDEARSAAVDSVIAGEIHLSDVYLPFQAEIRERILDQLQGTDYLDQGAEMASVIGTDVITTENERAAIEALPFSDSEMREAVAEGRLDEKIARIIMAARSDVRQGLGASGLNRKARLESIARANIAVVDEALTRPSLSAEDGGTSGPLETRVLAMRGLGSDDANPSFPDRSRTPAATIACLAGMEAALLARAGQLKKPPMPPRPFSVIGDDETED
jgi:hypothetical protein